MVDQGMKAVNSSAPVTNAQMPVVSLTARFMADMAGWQAIDQTEQRHLRLISSILPASQHGRLLPVWRAAGWLTGTLPAIFGAAAVFRTIDAVESFVDGHYAEQLDQLCQRSHCLPLYCLLGGCRTDKLMHRYDARGRLSAPGWAGRMWTGLVIAGSRLGVSLTRRY